jgi:hypothetical protein
MNLTLSASFEIVEERRKRNREDERTKRLIITDFLKF